MPVALCVRGHMPPLPWRPVRPLYLGTRHRVPSLRPRCDRLEVPQADSGPRPRRNLQKAGSGPCSRGWRPGSSATGWPVAPEYEASSVARLRPPAAPGSSIPTTSTARAGTHPGAPAPGESRLEGPGRRLRERNGSTCRVRHRTPPRVAGLPGAAAKAASHALRARSDTLAARLGALRTRLRARAAKLRARVAKLRTLRASPKALRAKPGASCARQKALRRGVQRFIRKVRSLAFEVPRFARKAKGFARRAWNLARKARSLALRAWDLARKAKSLATGASSPARCAAGPATTACRPVESMQLPVKHTGPVNR